VHNGINLPAVCLQLTDLVTVVYFSPGQFRPLDPYPIPHIGEIVVERRTGPYTSMLRSVSRIRNVCCVKVVSYSLVVQFLNVLNGWYIGVSIGMTEFYLTDAGYFSRETDNTHIFSGNSATTQHDSIGKI
jgi:hypothetical protein